MNRKRRRERVSDACVGSSTWRWTLRVLWGVSVRHPRGGYIYFARKMLNVKAS